MRFQITRLCGGKALMCTSRDIMSLDMEKARTVLESRGEVKSFDEMMAVSTWNEMEVTLYPQGKVMFYPLSDKDKAVEYATEIISEIQG
jgi:hypothetical protein